MLTAVRQHWNMATANRLAIVAGGLGGMGAAIGESLRKQGYTLALLYAPFEAENLEATLTSEYGGGGQTSVITTYCCDISDATAVLAAFNAIEQHLVISGGNVLPSVLINAASYVSLHPLETTPALETVEHLHVNLLGPILLAQAFANLYFKYTGTYKNSMPPGRIVNVASQAAHAALAQHGAYCASKSGLIGATRSMAFEWAGRGITANSISPGPVMTDLGEKAWESETVRAAYLAQVPTGTFAQAEEVAAAALFLCSDEARNINGTDVRIDGGFTAR